MVSDSDNEAVTIVLNPVSGSGDHAKSVRDRALLRGYDLLKTEAEGDAVDLAQEAVEDGATLVAAAGGDGTLNEVIRGVAAADALDEVTIGVIPVGTGNNFAQNIGITDIDDAFRVLNEGPRHQVDLGAADGNLFVNSCITGLTADASGETDPELKNKYGVAAYVINTFETITDFDGLRLSVDVWNDDRREPAWSGNAVCVLVGNGRRFSLQGNTQANMEDGLFDVTIVENAPASDLVEEALLERLIGKEASQTVRLHASSLDLEAEGGDPITFSLDGETIESRELALDVLKRALTIPVGSTYKAHPEYDDAVNQH
jgi:YegS/Rv2252/BmrU family lipid kinase